MVGELITLPLRVGVRATQLWLRVTGEAAQVAIKLAVRTLEGGGRDNGSAHGTPAMPSSVKAPQDSPARGVRAVPAPSAVRRTETPLPPLHEVPVHVSEQPELVEERSEPGAEDGAGAQVQVQEPWDGYEQSNAREVIARLASADSAQLAAVQLYEGGHKRRQTILAAVEREFRSSANGSGSPTRERNR